VTTIHTVPDGLGGVFMHAGTVRLGHVFPTVTSGLPHYRPASGCIWFGRRTHGKARPFPDHEQAYAYVCGETDGASGS
jgi:hypothetical protein